MAACSPHKAFCLDLQAHTGEQLEKTQEVATSVFLSQLPCQELGLSSPALGAASCPESSPQMSVALVMQRNRATSGLIFYKSCIFCIAQDFRQEKY